jgi:TatD DNase family protein
MNIVDSHNHIHFRAFSHDREEALSRAFDGGVTSMLTVGIDPKDCKKAIDVARGHEGVFVSIGIHPQNADKYGVKEVQTLAGLSSDPCVVAIGETGFDLFRTPQSEPRQKELFAAHIELARRLRLPLVIHDRQAHEQTIQVMNDTNAWPIGGVFHCFSGDSQLAQTVTGKGFYISIPGVVSYKSAHELKDVVARTPLEYLLVETDARYLTPEPFRGKRNEPLYVAKVVEEIARIKKTSAEEVARITSGNFSRLFLRRSPDNLK